MSRQTLRDRNQHVIGYIDVEFSGRQCLRNPPHTRSLSGGYSKPQ